MNLPDYSSSLDMGISCYFQAVKLPNNLGELPNLVGIFVDAREKSGGQSGVLKFESVPYSLCRACACGLFVRHFLIECSSIDHNRSMQPTGFYVYVDWQFKTRNINGKQIYPEDEVHDAYGAQDTGQL